MRPRFPFATIGRDARGRYYVASRHRTARVTRQVAKRNDRAAIRLAVDTPLGAVIDASVVRTRAL